VERANVLELLGDLLAGVRDGRRGGQAIEKAGGGVRGVALASNRQADAQATHTGGVVELIVGERDDQLGDAGREGLRRGADTAVVDQGRGARQDAAEGNVLEVTDSAGQWLRDLLGVA